MSTSQTALRRIRRVADHFDRGFALSNSVGDWAAGARNEPRDVEAVQLLLEHAARRLSQPEYDPKGIDGKIARSPGRSSTVRAIIEFQRRFMRVPDGIVEPLQQTLSKLLDHVRGHGPESLQIARAEMMGQRAGDGLPIWMLPFADPRGQAIGDGSTGSEGYESVFALDRFSAGQPSPRLGSVERTAPSGPSRVATATPDNAPSASSPAVPTIEPALGAGALTQLGPASGGFAGIAGGAMAQGLGGLSGPAADAAGSEPEWIGVAEGELGETEIIGRRHNERVIEYHRSTTTRAMTDENPWCSSFINWVIEQAGYTGTNSAWSHSWKRWGRGLRQPAIGAIGFIDWGRVHPNDPTRRNRGHVGFIVGRTARGSLVMLGGNQAGQVKYSSFPRRNFAAFRVPTDYALPESAYDLPILTITGGGGGFNETR